MQDFTVALSLPDCSAQLRYQCLLFRGRCRMDVGEPEAAPWLPRCARLAASLLNLLSTCFNSGFARLPKL